LARMHSRTPPAEKTVFEIQARLLGLGHNPSSKTRWRVENLDRLTSEPVMKIRDLLIELGGFEELFLRAHPSPWTGSLLRDGKAAREAIEAAAEVAGSLLPNAASE